MADILCPNCNMPNPDDQNVCSFCRQPLHVAADDEAIRPGDMPTKKNTSELEPILPQWLREARTRARENAEEDQAEQVTAESAKPAAEESSAPDWLAGLEAAAKEDNEEDIPDWMRGMTPSKPAVSTLKREQPAKEEPKTFTRRQEISWEEEPAPAPRPVEPPPTGPLGATQSEDGIPYWLKNIQEEAPEEKKEVDNFLAKKEEPTPQGNVSPFESGTFRPNTGELINWLDKMSPQVGEQAPSMPSPDLPASEPLPDWISRLDSEPAEAAPAAPVSNDFNFDWLKEESSKPFTPFQPSQMEQESSHAEKPIEEAAPAELPDWMEPGDETSQQPLTFASLEPSAESPASPEEEKEEVPDWLNTMSAAETPPGAPVQENVPDWMHSAAEASPVEQTQPSSDLPDWMKTFASEPSPAETPTSVPEASNLPDWIQPMPQEPASRMEEASAFDWITPESASHPPAEQPSGLTNVPAFVAGDDALNTGELFSAEMPDWLSGIAPTESKSAANIPQPETPAGESIAPAELPSWVQAMRPVEAALPGTPATQEPITGPAESQGPLAGLRGVLPDMPGLATSGKPKIYSIRLEPTADQQQHASLLEKMLEDETQAKPMRAGSFMLGSQRVLRWVVTLILIGLISFVVFARLQITPLPAALSQEGALVLPVLDAVPSDAPVLLVFDYEPALAGELEVTAASFLDRLTALRNPQYSVLSTSPTGAALAERFFKNSDTILPERITSLGYLPGESSGILSFAIQPRGTENVSAFSDYASMVLLTDRAESARAWVEQTTDYRGGRPLVVISSAQAAPMIQPYLISGQVNGLLSGLRDGAAFEGLSGQSGVARRYWDAYNLSLLVIVILIFFGGMWNLFAGLRARRQEQADA